MRARLAGIARLSCAALRRPFYGDGAAAPI